MGVNIYESPIKPVVDLEDGVTVYVPGYSYFGPEEPTLCYSESEFEGLFGSTPYLFETDQTTSKIAAGSPEKGYLYAKSLLASGLRVLFHRVKKGGAVTAEVPLTLSYGQNSVELYLKATNFGKAYNGIKIKFAEVEGVTHLYSVEIKDPSGNIIYSGNISFDPTNSFYFKSVNMGLVEIVAKNDAGEYLEVEDAKMANICSWLKETKESKISLSEADSKGFFTLRCPDSPDNTCEFEIDGEAGLLYKMEDGLMSPLTDFERYPSVTYITSGGYYVNNGVALKMMEMAEKIKAIALIDLEGVYSARVKDSNSWKTAQTALVSIGGSTLQRGKSAAFIGCNSFNVTPYRLILGDSFNYLKCLGENMKRGVKDWIPVANDPNGVSPLGYDTTAKISTELAETMAEGKIGVSANPLIYSTSAGGYKIMGNRTLLSNDGVLSPNSFLNVSVVVNKVERACRQAANKLKIVSTNPVDTFNKFKLLVAKTVDKMVVYQDGITSYKIRRLPKTQPATIDIEIVLVVVEGIETFNIYIPYSIALD